MPHPPLSPLQPVYGTTQGAGQRIDDAKGRIFPCGQCGADLEFSIGQQSLECPFCGWKRQLEIDPSAAVEEQDFRAMLDRLAEQRRQGSDDAVKTSEVRCESCGATVVFQETLTSSECACCGSPIQREKIHDSPLRVPVDGVLPFHVEQQRAKGNLAAWVRSRWFAPNEFLQRGVQGKFSGVYLPFWTFDAMTANRYAGQRGDNYTVTVGTSKNQRTETRTRWTRVSGAFQRFFDDVLVTAATGVPDHLLQRLEPWPLQASLPFNQQVLAGFLAHTYSVPLDAGFQEARQRIKSAIEQEVIQRIDGDHQRVESIQTHFGAISYKHLLLPTWLMAYRYREKTYQVAVNATTSEVQGDRPYSWVKILLAVLGAAGLAAIATVVAQLASNGP